MDKTAKRHRSYAVLFLQKMISFCSPPYVIFLYIKYIIGKGWIFLPEGTFVTITGFKNDYDKIPFAIGAKFLCAKEPGNPYDTGPSCPCPKWTYRRICRQQRAYQGQWNDVSRPRV